MSAFLKDEVLIACGTDDLLSFSLLTGQFHEIYTTKRTNEKVLSSTFDASTKTLLLFILEPDPVRKNDRSLGLYYLVSFGQNETKWTKMERHLTDLQPDVAEEFDPDLTVCDSHVLLGDGKEGRLNVFRIYEKHKLKLMGYEFLEKNLYGLAMTRFGDVWFVAFALETSVSLYRLVSFSPLKLEQRNVSFIGTPHRLLFLEDLLLVSDWNETTRSHGILSLRSSGGALNEPRKLLDTVHYGIDYSGL